MTKKKGITLVDRSIEKSKRQNASNIGLIRSLSTKTLDEFEAAIQYETVTALDIEYEDCIQYRGLPYTVIDIIRDGTNLTFIARRHDCAVKIKRFEKATIKKGTLPPL